jgi:N-methylhydantoinase B
MIDPITIATIGSALVATTGEMSESLRRSSYSPIIREMLDYSCGVFTAQGEMAAQSETIPALLGAMAFALQALLEDHPPETLAPGDIFIANDPYRGGTHTPDIHLFAPVFHGERLVAWTGTLAHHVDIGGTNPGTEGYANRSIFEEGLRFPPLRLYEAGRPVVPLFRYIEANVREPRATLGDLRAQTAAVRLGGTRLLGLIDRYGLDTVNGVMGGLIAQTERRLRHAIRQRPDGSSTAVGYLDNDGVGNDDIRIEVTVRVRGDEVEVDFAGTAPQMAGGMNAPRSAVMAAVLFAVKAVFDPEAAPNSGTARAIRVHRPRASVVDPVYPAAVSLRHLTSQRITDTIVRAFQQLYPDVGAAGAFVGFSSLAAEGRHPRTGLPTVIQDDLGGGMGGTSSGDGLDGVDTYLGNVGILPAEVCEMQYPVRVVRTELVPDSGGPGRHRGGMGLVREYLFTDSCDLVAYTEQSDASHAAWASDGGLPGWPARVTLERLDGRRVEIAKQRLHVERGDRLVVSTGGGGGHGRPGDREAGLVLRDLREGRISADAARDVYRWRPAEESGG